MLKKKLRIAESFEEMDTIRLNENIQSSLEDRWEAFWHLKKFHKFWFSSETPSKDNRASKKQLIISKPEWI